MKFANWEETEMALSAISRLIKMMCDIKPPATAPKAEIKAWDNEMRPVRAWAIEIHYERIRLLQEEQNERRKFR